jgi:hypothetical protein
MPPQTGSPHGDATLWNFGTSQDAEEDWTFSEDSRYYSATQPALARLFHKWMHDSMHA